MKTLIYESKLVYLADDNCYLLIKISLTTIGLTRLSYIENSLITIGLGFSELRGWTGVTRSLQKIGLSGFQRRLKSSLKIFCQPYPSSI